MGRREEEARVITGPRGEGEDLQYGRDSPDVARIPTDLGGQSFVFHRRQTQSEGETEGEGLNGVKFKLIRGDCAGFIKPIKSRAKVLNH